MNEGIWMAAGLTAEERARREWLRLPAEELIEVATGRSPGVSGCRDVGETGGGGRWR